MGHTGNKVIIRKHDKIQYVCECSQSSLGLRHSECDLRIMESSKIIGNMVLINGMFSILYKRTSGESLTLSNYLLPTNIGGPMFKVYGTDTRILKLNEKM